MDLGALGFVGEGEDEVWMLAGSGFDVLVDLEGYDGAEGLRVFDVTEAPDRFELFLGKGAAFVDV